MCLSVRVHVIKTSTVWLCLLVHLHVYNARIRFRRLFEFARGPGGGVRGIFFHYFIMYTAGCVFREFHVKSFMWNFMRGTHACIILKKLNFAGWVGVGGWYPWHPPPGSVHLYVHELFLFKRLLALATNAWLYCLLESLSTAKS